WRWTINQGSEKFTTRHVLGTSMGVLAFVLAALAFLNVRELAARHSADLPRDISFLAPVQQAASALSVQVANLPDKFSLPVFLSNAWPALAALALWLYGWLAAKP